MQQRKYLPADTLNHAQIRLRRAGTREAVELRLSAQFSPDLAQKPTRVHQRYRGGSAMQKTSIFESPTDSPAMISLRHRHRPLWKGQHALRIALRTSRAKSPYGAKRAGARLRLVGAPRQQVTQSGAA